MVGRGLLAGCLAGLALAATPVPAAAGSVVAGSTPAHPEPAQATGGAPVVAGPASPDPALSDPAPGASIPAAPEQGRTAAVTPAPAGFSQTGPASSVPAPVPVPADPPMRVVSMNLCTDQMAMLLAAPGQLVSVSHLARDPRSSAMVEAAGAYPANRGQAEEILGFRPDLVLAGAWTNRTSVDLLRRMGVRVETFAPESDIPAIRDGLRRMGALLGREAAAEALLAAFDADLARLEGDAPDPRPRAALYAANGYTSGSDSLSGRIVALGGFANIADGAGIAGGGVLPLELLLLSRPDMLILDRPYAGHSRSEEILDHPALVSARSWIPAAALSSPDWICGTPFILRAATALRDARQGLAP